MEQAKFSGWVANNSVKIIRKNEKKSRYRPYNQKPKWRLARLRYRT